MTVSSIALEDSLKQRTAAARAAKPVATKTTKVPAGQKRVKPKPTGGEGQPTPTAKPTRITGEKKHDPFATLKPRDAKVWDEFPNALKIACPVCGAAKGKHCRDKKSLRTPHKPRRAAK